MTLYTHRILCFESTGDAYDACQCDESVRDGDILLIVSEGVVGIADTWPVAVTEKHGNLHTLADGYTFDNFRDGRFKHHAEYARELAASVLS